MNPTDKSYKWWEDRVVHATALKEPNQEEPEDEPAAAAAEASTASPPLSWQSGASTERGSETTREARWNARRRARRRAGLTTGDSRYSYTSDVSVSTEGSRYYPELPRTGQSGGSQTARGPRRPPREHLFQAMQAQLFPGIEQSARRGTVDLPAPPPMLPTHVGFFQVPTKPADI